MENFDGRKRNRSGGTAFYVTLAVAFLLIAAILAMAIFFKVSRITVEGAERYTPEEIIEASGIELDNSIFFLGTGDAQIAIKKELPYVDTVKITRSLPGTVTISVTESRGAAYFFSGGSCWLIDLDGRILEETTSAGVGGAVELRGITAVDPEVGRSLSLGSGESVRLNYLKNTLKALDQYGRISLTTWLDLTNLAAVTFECNGYRINIGEAEDFEVKFGKLLKEFFDAHPEKGYGQSVVYDKELIALRYMN